MLGGAVGRSFASGGVEGSAAGLFRVGRAASGAGGLAGPGPYPASPSCGGRPGDASGSGARGQGGGGCGLGASSGGVTGESGVHGSAD